MGKLKMKEKLTWRGLWSNIKIIAVAFYGVMMISFVAILGFIIWLTAGNDEMANNSLVVNKLALMVGLFSLPSIAISFLTVFDWNKQKSYKATTKCPHCKNTVDLRLTEE